MIKDVNVDMGIVWPHLGPGNPISYLVITTIDKKNWLSTELRKMILTQAGDQHGHR